MLVLYHVWLPVALLAATAAEQIRQMLLVDGTRDWRGSVPSAELVTCPCLLARRFLAISMAHGGCVQANCCEAEAATAANAYRPSSAKARAARPVERICVLSLHA
eukprot:GHUV01018998.1.p1 GENE.GHUV01018998.1~~GHUV01018998.1.p1  ORF type:complete len:105 (-),score=0.03 GHUV01018998.1:29-343(-)